MGDDPSEPKSITTVVRLYEDGGVQIPEEVRKVLGIEGKTGAVLELTIRYTGERV